MITSIFTQLTNLESMKRITLLFIFMAIGFGSFAQEIDMNRIKFVNDFYTAVVAHDQSKVIKMTEKGYRKEQIKFLDGNKDQFVNELFSGMDVNGDEYVNTTFNQITNIELIDVHPRGEVDWEYVFHITAGDRMIERALLLRQTGKKYGFIGSQG
jgi:hypothetical protein